MDSDDEDEVPIVVVVNTRSAHDSRSGNQNEGSQTEPGTTKTASDPHVGVLDKRSTKRTMRGGDWREEGKSRATKLRTRAKNLEAHQPTDTIKLNTNVFDPLDRAEKLLLNRQTIREWWSGSQIEDCWRLLREAEEGMLTVVDGGRIKNQAQRVLTDVTEVLGDGDQHVKELKALLDVKDDAADPEYVRDAALTVLAASHEHSDAHHRGIRQFRNTLTVVVLVMCVAAVVLIGLQWALGNVPLITSPENWAGGHWQLLSLVLLFGAVGALISAVPSLSQLPKEPQPFNMKTPQAALKVATGAWAAVLGLMAVNAGLMPAAAAASTTAAASGGSTTTTTLGGILFIAAVFGAGQEAVTRFADHKASELLPTTDDKS